MILIYDPYNYEYLGLLNDVIRQPAGFLHRLLIGDALTTDVPF